MKSPSSSARSCLSPILWLFLLFACVGFILFSFAPSPARAALFASPTPTQENRWAYMDIAKPTYTATAVVPPTPIPTLMPASTETPSQMVMQIVDDTAAATQSPDQPAPAPSYGGSKLIVVDISEQHMYVYDGDTLVYSFVVSTGIGNSTRVGTFAVQDKIPNAYASTWDLWMPNWLGIYYSHGLENGIHALPILHSGATLWAGFLGTPVSFGCIVLDTYDSQVLYDWADIGTPVNIQW